MKARRTFCVGLAGGLLASGLFFAWFSMRSHPASYGVSAAGTNAIEDNFTRADQTGWGATTNLNSVPNVAWGIDGDGSKPFVRIGGNAGAYAYPGAINVAGIASAGSAAFDGGDSLVRFQVNATGHVTPYVVENACADKSCYYGARLHTSQNALELAKRVANSTTILASIPFTASANTAYWMRLDVNAGSASAALQAKIWQDGLPEPAGWMVSATDASPLAANPAGAGGSWDVGGSGEAIRYSCYAYAASAAASPCSIASASPTATATSTAPSPTPVPGAIKHYLYTLPEGGTVYVYDIDNGHALVQTIALPASVSYVRGFAADPVHHALYVAYRGNPLAGWLMKMDLLTNQVLYTAPMPVEVDSFSITPDGNTIYMPDGDGQTDGIWRVVDAATGNVTGSIDAGGHNPHNTIVTLSGKYVLMGPRLSNYLVIADTATNTIIRQIGPVQNGVRPFTVNGGETLAFIETSGFIGFDVADMTTGTILWVVAVPGYSYPSGSGYAPSHGISLSPDEKELYVPDWPNSIVHVFAVSGLPTTAPAWVANIPVHNMVGAESPCVGSNCAKEGWVLHSRDGRFVYVGDAGDVIDTATRQSVAFLPSLANTRKAIEIDWANGVPVFTTTRYGLGYLNSASDTPTPVTTSTPTPTATTTPMATCQEDLDHDGTVGFGDLLIFAQAYNATASSANWNPAADFDHNGTVGFPDLLLIAKHYNQTAAVCAASPP